MDLLNRCDNNQSMSKMINRIFYLDICNSEVKIIYFHVITLGVKIEQKDD